MGYDFINRLDYRGRRSASLNINALVYTRGSISVTIRNFTPEKIQVAELLDLGSVQIDDKHQAFCFDSSKLAAFNPETPVAGTDRITWNNRTYTVAKLGDRSFHPVTSSRNRIIVFAVETTNG